MKLKAEDRNKDWIIKSKKNAAMEAVKHIENGFALGLGSGSTVAYVIEELGSLIRQKKWTIFAVPTSNQSFLLAVENRIAITTLNEHPKLDLTIDGADQVDPKLNLIKGIGGALTKEKIVAFSSKKNIVVIDETKLTKKLGKDQPVPIEVLPFALTLVQSSIKKINGNPILREGTGKVGPVISDNGNLIIDADFGPIRTPNKLNANLKSIPGIIETGLFVGTTDIVYVGTPTHVHKFQRE